MYTISPYGPNACAAIEHTQEKENITRTPIFPKSATKAFHENIYHKIQAALRSQNK
jgi:hypothetical protein